MLADSLTPKHINIQQTVSFASVFLQIGKYAYTFLQIVRLKQVLNLFIHMDKTTKLKKSNLRSKFSY